MQLTNFCLTLEKWNEFFNTIKQNVQLINKNDDFSDLIETLNLDISEGTVIYLLYLYYYCYTRCLILNPLDYLFIRKAFLEKLFLGIFFLKCFPKKII